jgi:uncharacterized protein (DUF2141 family)
MLANMQLSQQLQLFLGTRGARATLVLSVIAATPVLAGDLTIELSGITPGRGQIYVAIYDRPDTFPTAGRQRTGQILDASGQSLVVQFKDLPPGEYAAVAFQDVNGNGKLDKNFLGMPKEPYGFSNGARGSAGPPKFSAAAVTLNPDGTTTIVLK